MTYFTETHVGPFGQIQARFTPTRTRRIESRRASLLGVPLLALALLGAAPVTSGTDTDAAIFKRMSDRMMAGSRIPGGPMAYLVTPAGHLFRVLGSQPILEVDGTKLGLLLSYVGESRDPVASTAEAVELMNALGPDWQVGGETAVLVQSRVGFDARNRFNSSVAFHTGFSLRDGRWAQLAKPPPRPDLPKSIGTGPLEVKDDPSFPFDPLGLGAAAEVAGRWLVAADSGDASRLSAEMSGELLSKVKSGSSAWEEHVAARARLELRGGRRELYLLQTWEGEPSPRGSRIWAVYAVDVEGVGEGVEKVHLAKESGRWRVLGYGLLFPKAKENIVRSLRLAR